MSKQKKILLLICAFVLASLVSIILLNKSHSVNKAYITNQGEDSVSVVNLDTLKLEKKISVGKSPLGISIVNSKDIAVVGNIESQSLSIIDLKVNEVIKTIPINATPLGIVADADGSRVFITSWFKNQVLVLSISDPNF
jgi:YVTN family beta-propeller protein